MMIPWIGAAALQAFSVNLRIQHISVGNIVEPLLLSTCLIAQVYRYRRVSTPTERQQTKWVVLGIVAALSGFGVILAWGAVNGNYDPSSTGWPLNQFIFNPVINMLLSLIPISIAIAILRARLFDIDLLVNRVLVYGLLTGLLGTLYVGLVVGLESLAGRFVGPAASNPPILVASTLLIAALVQPVRRRLQQITDRRFYRRRYDATRTLAAFSATLRNEVELARLHTELLAVVDETMRPAHLSLWLRSQMSPGHASSEPLVPETLR